MKTKDEIIKDLLTAVDENGVLKNELKQDLKIKGINVTPQENYIRVSLTLYEPVKAFNADKKNPTKYELGENNVIFVSLYSIAAILRDNDQARFAVNKILNNPESVQVILDGAKIDIIQEYVEANQEYSNPFASEEKPKVMAHDTIVNHVTDIKLSEFGLTNLRDLAKAMLGIYK